ncbi:MAG: hypothetical protein ABR976_17410 [Terracidiphilus sp.]
MRFFVASISESRCEAARCISETGALGFQDHWPPAAGRRPAAAIVEAAKEFGQSDDLTVVTITRQAAVANAA